MKNLLTHLSGALSSRTKYIPLLGILVLALAVPLTLNLIQQNQDNRQQAAEPEPQRIAQVDPGAGGAGTCASVNGECMSDAEWRNTKALFAAAAIDMTTYTCPTVGDVCKVQSRATVDNQTCEGSCDFNSRSACEGEGGTVTGDSCFNTNVCCSVPSGNSGANSCTQSPGELGTPCSDGSGNFSCGICATGGCPLCSPTADCSTGRYTIATCSTGSSCTNDTECANLDPSCPVGQTGSMSCDTARGHCVSSCQ